jgi:hypothetical protein
VAGYKRPLNGSSVLPLIFLLHDVSCLGIIIFINTFVLYINNLFRCK